MLVPLVRLGGGGSCLVLRSGIDAPHQPIGGRE
jgi:hypothetical protein